MTTRKRIFEHRVCYVSSPEDGTILIAFDIETEANTVRWFDTIKERRMRIGEVIEDTHEHFIFKRNDGQQTGMYTFIPMTLDIYNEKVKHKILSPKEFDNEEKMWRAFKKTKENAW